MRWTWVPQNAIVTVGMVHNNTMRFIPNAANHSKSIIYLIDIYELLTDCVTAASSKQLTPMHVLTGELSQQTSHTHPILIKGCASVADAGLTIKQRWVSPSLE